MYALTTHSRPRVPTRNPSPIVGRATLTMVVSNPTTNRLVQQIARMPHRRRASSPITCGSIPLEGFMVGLHLSKCSAVLDCRKDRCSPASEVGKNFAETAKMDGMDAEFEQLITDIGPRLRTLRRDRGLTLEGLSEATGVSVSALSRLESGKRRPTLDLLLPLARAHRVALDQLVGAPATGDPRVHLTPSRRKNGSAVVPLTRYPRPRAGLQAGDRSASTEARHPRRLRMALRPRRGSASHPGGERGSPTPRGSRGVRHCRAPLVRACR